MTIESTDTGITYAPSWTQATDPTDGTADTVAPTPAWADVAAASTEAEREAKTERVLRLVSVPLTDADQAAKAVALAAVTQEIATAKAHLKETAAGLRDEIKALEVRQAKVAEEIASGRGSVEVPCKRIPIWEQNAWRIVREDTGEEIGLEPMGVDERQLTIDDALPGDDEDAMLDDDEPAELETRLDAALADADAEGDITEPAAILDGAAEEPAKKPKRGRKKKG